MRKRLKNGCRNNSRKLQKQPAPACLPELPEKVVLHRVPGTIDSESTGLEASRKPIDNGQWPVVGEEKKEEFCTFPSGPSSVRRRRLLINAPLKTHTTSP